MSAEKKPKRHYPAVPDSYAEGDFTREEVDAMIKEYKALEARGQLPELKPMDWSKLGSSWIRRAHGVG